MYRWATEIQAISPVTGNIETYAGPTIKAPSLKLAEEYCDNNGLGYCMVIGRLCMEGDSFNEDGTPDFRSARDFDNLN